MQISVQNFFKTYQKASKKWLKFQWKILFFKLVHSVGHCDSTSRTYVTNILMKRNLVTHIKNIYKCLYQVDIKRKKVCLWRCDVKREIVRYFHLKTIFIVKRHLVVLQNTLHYIVTTTDFLVYIAKYFSLLRYLSYDFVYSIVKFNNTIRI